MLRTVGAFLVAPFPVALTQAIIVGLWPKEGQGVFENPPSMFLALYLYFYVFGLLIGLPIWLILRRRMAMNLRAFSLIGLVVGLLPVGIALVLARSHLPAMVIAYNLALFAGGGAAAGLLFRLIARRDGAKEKI